MMDNFQERGWLEPRDRPERWVGNPDWSPEAPRRSGWFDGLPGLSGIWQWEEMAAEIGQESCGRVVIAGLPGAGKSLLFNRLRGWSISPAEAHEGGEPGVHPQLPYLEPFGSFILARLPAQTNGTPLLGEELWLGLGDPSLIVYLIDVTTGVQPADYRWVSTLRAGGRPLVAVLNKCDLHAHYSERVLETERRLGMPVIPISAATGLNVETRLLPALLDAAPKVTVPLGREIVCLRRQAARRLVRQAALFAGLMGAQPIPLLDLPVQAALQAGVVMRVGAVYGRMPAGGVNREIVGAVAGTLGFRYLMLTLVKLVPILGWAVGGLASSVLTLLVGEAAIHYHESGGTVPLREYLSRSRRWLWGWAWW
jgi:uncharacterized protein (DUF697 family)/GTPase SAR1 family protein